MTPDQPTPFSKTYKAGDILSFTIQEYITMSVWVDEHMIISSDYNATSFVGVLLRTIEIVEEELNPNGFCYAKFLVVGSDKPFTHVCRINLSCKKIEDALCEMYQNGFQK